ncbi:family 78 glycoside hydrolase catalytic domain [Streptococcus ovuberis]|uniref:alpha-L-rhamnosidase n=1 Tax=Streptococcus ovuberis TaxID=1936207 RepID=A0A7X6S1H5_9STRE|nr:family 78 glycoside hydrolase catalytic domain [Streptococcus ovuberis]NKZ20360.1 family 78 glycoside hydrolase catalytic domain [Streptococcus ovuberis]
MTKKYNQKEHFLEAKWITRKDNPIEKEFSFFQDKPNMTFSKNFIWDGESKASLAVCGLGYYTAYLNGQRLGDAFLNSDVTNYDKVVYYDTYDISPYLKRGTNKIIIELANGWYNPAPVHILGKYNIRKQLPIGKPCLICDIQIGERHIYSDSTWDSGFGHLLQNDIYIGEVFTDENWNEDSNPQTVAVPGPAGQLVPSFIPKIKRHETIRPVNIERFGENWLVDFGQILSGQIAFEVKPDYIGTILLQYAEEKSSSGGKLDFTSTISGRYGLKDDNKNIEPDKPIIQEDQIIKTKTGVLHYSNQYTYHSFRYVVVKTGSDSFPLREMIAYRVHTSVENISQFECSSEVLNQLWIAGRNTRLHNIHSYFEDCSRERLGYGGDIVALLQTHLNTIDAEKIFKKVLIDFINDQRLDGGITQTAPYVGIMTNGTSNGSGALGWQLVLPTLALTILEEHGDKDFIEQYQEALKKHLNHLMSFDYDYVKMCCLGDWGSIDETASGFFIKSPDQEFCSAVMYLLNLQTYQKLSRYLSDLKPYQEELGKVIEIVKHSIKNEFYDDVQQRFASGSASSIIFALRTGLVDDEVIWYDKLVVAIRSRDGIFPFGIFGMSWAYEEFAKRGDNRLIFDWLTRQATPSYMDMIRSGNQTLSEHFSGGETFTGSKNHAMFSSYSSWLIREVLGIKVSGGRIEIAPASNLPLEWVKGSYQLPEGRVQLEWTHKDLSIYYSKALKDRISIETDLNIIVNLLD